MSAPPFGKNALTFSDAVKQFATSLAIDDGSVAKVVASGRARWKIENENNNTLKTKGYRFKHNFGHGRPSPATLILLAVCCTRY